MMSSIQALFNLKGKVAIVTGGATGIGKGIALRLAEAGTSIILTDVNMESARKTSSEMKTMGYKVKEVKADSSKLDDIDLVVSEALNTFNDLNILVNNAGIFPFSPAIDVTESIWDRTIDINLKGAMFFAQAAAKAMLAKNHGGKIINIASVDAFHPTGNLTHYDASKGGLVMLTKSLGKEWAPKGILVNGVAPGAIRTPGAAAAIGDNMTKEQVEALTKAFVSQIPLGRQGEPDDIAKVVLFLASEASNYIVGTTIIADGGYLVG